MTRDVHSVKQHYLNIASYSARTQALGPGTRAVIWVQGCPFNCPGCLAPDWIPITPARLMTPEDILDKIDLSNIDGLTFSGGEPMLQAEGLATLMRMAREKKQLDLICFTGYRYERLLQSPPNPGVKELLKQVDTLIDGTYIQSQNDSIGLRGSSNQKIIHLTDKLKGVDLETQQRKVEVYITNGEVSVIGIPTPEIKIALEKAFQPYYERMCHERL